MKKLLWLIALLPALTLAAPPVCTSGDTEFICTAADTTTPYTDTVCTEITEGGPLTNKKFCTVWISAVAGQTLSGAGTVDFYLYDPYIGRWAKDNVNSGAAVSTATVRDQVIAQLYIPGPRGRICPVVQGVTSSGGGAPVITFICTK
jgi:hypothetical protein